MRLIDSFLWGGILQLEALCPLSVVAFLHSPFDDTAASSPSPKARTAGKLRTRSPKSSRQIELGPYGKPITSICLES